MTILLMSSVIDFHDWNRQSMFRDVDYRVYAWHRVWWAVLIASVDFSPSRHREIRSIKIAVHELWRFSLWFLESRRLQFQNEQWAFGNWSRLDFKIIMISVWPNDTVKQGLLNEPCANSDNIHDDFSLRKIDTVKHGVGDFQYENWHRETRPLNCANNIITARQDTLL